MILVTKCKSIGDNPNTLVVRGGDVWLNPRVCRSAYRYYRITITWSQYMGLRIVLRKRVP